MDCNSIYKGYSWVTTPVKTHVFSAIYYVYNPVYN